MEINVLRFASDPDFHAWLYNTFFQNLYPVIDMALAIFGMETPQLFIS